MLRIFPKDQFVITPVDLFKGTFTITPTTRTVWVRYARFALPWTLLVGTVALLSNIADNADLESLTEDTEVDFPVHS